MKTISVYRILLIPFFAVAQEPTKWQKMQSEKISAYVLDKIEMSDEDAQFFNQVNLNQLIENAKNIKSSGATSQEEKKVIYAEGRKNLKSKLSERFGKKIAQQIMNAINESRKK